MILLDNNQIILASLFQSMKYSNELNEDFIRHLVLNTYRMYRNKFSNTYGELVICHDSGNCWRKDFFPQYKQNRKKQQDKSPFDWKEIHSAMDKIRGEIRDVFPYKNIQIPRTEADDLIATICKNYHTEEKILIVSSDKDFQQLQIYPNIKQYSPTTKKFLVCENPKQFLLDHILRGDTSDGIPNILSDDDVYLDVDKRQKRLTKKTIEGLYEEVKDGTIKEREHWNRNKNLVDLSCIPDTYKEQTLEAYNTATTNKRDKLLNYFIDKKLKNLMEHIGEF
tara:strand:+ start:873 stop:1712 length:840 start_codon:yes stop_codon:yes gene_type:complete